MSRWLLLGHILRRRYVETIIYYFSILFVSILKDGSLSDTAVSSIDPIDRMRHSRHEASRGGRAGAAAAGNAAAAGSAGLGKKSNSTSQLSAAGNKAFFSRHFILMRFTTFP